MKRPRYKSAPAAVVVMAILAGACCADVAHARGPRGTDASARVGRAHFFGPRERRGEAPSTGGSFLATGFARPVWFALRLAGFFRRPGFDGAQSIERVDGRRVCEFPIDDHASGVLVRVGGRVEFERAMIGFADGRVELVDAFGLERGDGVFELAGFGEAHQVSWVRLVLRARTAKARVGVLLAR